MQKSNSFDVMRNVTTTLAVLILLFVINQVSAQEHRVTFEEHSPSSFQYSTQLEPGAYEVEIEFGGPSSSNTTVYAESRRLLIRELELEANNYQRHRFLVDVRTPRINSTTVITVKDRDKDILNWDPYLNLEFVGTPQIKSIHVRPINHSTTVFLAGNSTVADQDTEPWASWGQFLPYFFNSEVLVANYAESGSSLHDFKNSHRLEAILNRMKEGDYLFIEFGHNDQKRKGENIGPWSSYSQYLREYVQLTRQKGGIPILVTPIQRRFFNEDGTIKNTHGDYPSAVRKVAQDLDVPLIDLTELTAQMYEAWGVEDSKKAFMHYPEGSFQGQEQAITDNTHFNSFGAFEIASCVVEEIKTLNLDIKKSLINQATYSVDAPRSFRHWTLPASVRF